MSGPGRAYWREFWASAQIESTGPTAPCASLSRSLASPSVLPPTPPAGLREFSSGGGCRFLRYPPLSVSETATKSLISSIPEPSLQLFSVAMEGIVRKYQQKFRRVREEMDRWGELQARLLSQYRNASSIIERLQVIQESKNYGILSCVDGIGDAVVGKQMESLEMILLSLNKTMEEFHGIVLSLEKIHRDSRQLVKGGSTQMTVKQLQQRLGVKPSLQDCLDGLMLLHDMHHSEYLLKSSIISALPTVILRPSAADLGSLQQLLVDQPNVPKEEVEFIFDIIFAEDIC